MTSRYHEFCLAYLFFNYLILYTTICRSQRYYDSRTTISNILSDIHNPPSYSFLFLVLDVGIVAPWRFSLNLWSYIFINLTFPSKRVWCIIVQTLHKKQFLEVWIICCPQHIIIVRLFPVCSVVDVVASNIYSWHPWNSKKLSISKFSKFWKLEYIWNWIIQKLVWQMCYENFDHVFKNKK